MSANVQAVCASFKQQILQAVHNLGTATIKAALYYQNESMGSGTTAYSSTGEVSGTGYTAGGTTISTQAPALSGTTAYWTPAANIQWTGLTISSAFDTCLLYNASESNDAIMTVTFGAQTISAGTFTITMPSNTSTTALLQVN